VIHTHLVLHFLALAKFAEVIGKVSPAFFDTMHSLFTGYGDIPQCGGSGPDPSRLSAEGNDYIFQEFPNCDFIMGADWWYDPRWT